LQKKTWTEIRQQIFLKREKIVKQSNSKLKGKELEQQVLKIINSTLNPELSTLTNEVLSEFIKKMKEK